MERNFHWIQGIQRIWGITEAWIGFSIRICSVTCVSVVLWYHLCLLHRRSWAHCSLLLFFIFYLTELIQWKHLEKTPISRKFSPLSFAYFNLFFLRNDASGGDANPIFFQHFQKIGPWDLCWFKRWRIYLLCFFAIGSKFVDISFAGVFDIFWTFLTHFS